MGQMDNILGEIVNNGGDLKQDELKELLATIYSKENLSAVLIEKYSVTPFVKDYLKILENGIESHFLGLHYSSVCTLIPVVEGVARKLAVHREVDHKYIKQTIRNLCLSCKTEVVQKKLGDYEEVESMIDSFEKFVTEKLYSDSSAYPHEDNTNRNGIAHGAYGDIDYGNPVSFYKVIALINSLCFLSAIDAGLSWFPPKGTEAGTKKAVYYSMCESFSNLRISCS